ncbi:MAG: Asp-tRNA(Asn)/Glu-tRNA(Gln) amidotransferase GatCAB subunit C [Methanomassiliicoccaceae archaeon]|nr:Asp-tRNA(Asn)/Glu-tRNA(Gln) amidotransferase GatCAB subunit C [Methanomassiliicoccaceae archaeon]
MDTDMLKRAAGAARIELTDEERVGFSEDIDKIFDLLNALNDAPSCNSLCFDPVGVSDALRDDVPVVDDNVGHILRNMSTYNGFVRGPKIV